MNLPEVRKAIIQGADGVAYDVSTLLSTDLRSVTEVIVFAPNGDQYDFGMNAAAAIIAAEKGADALAEDAEHVLRSRVPAEGGRVVRLSVRIESL